jgi:hypothetical protein
MKGSCDMAELYYGGEAGLPNALIIGKRLETLPERLATRKWLPSLHFLIFFLALVD